MSAKMAWIFFRWISLLFTSTFLFLGTEAREYCGRLYGKEYYCDSGHCCGNFDCCTYYKYYEMWWFWLVWGLISLLGCCCAYHRRRYYAHHAQIRNFVYPTVMSGAVPTSSYEELDTEPKYKLPSYAEVEAMGSLGPPADPLGAPPPYLDPFTNEGTQSGATNSYLNEALSDGSENVAVGSGLDLTTSEGTEASGINAREIPPQST